MSGAALPKERFTPRNPCPICGGSERDPRGQGKRCIGYIDSTGDFARCSREEYAGPLDRNTDDTYSHKLDGECGCGKTHGAPKPKPVRPPKTVTTIEYPIRDLDGNLIAHHVRKELDDGSKTFSWRNPSGGYTLQGSSPSDLLYGLEMLKQRPSDPVCIVEGEKAADAGNRAQDKVVFLGTVCGAPNAPNKGVLVHLAGRQVWLWADNDPETTKQGKPGRQGQRQMEAVLRNLPEDVKSVRWVNWPNAPEGADAADFDGDVLTLLRAAPLCTPSPDDRPTYEQVGMGYVAHFPLHHVTMKLSRIRHRGGDTTGRLTVTHGDRHLQTARFNLDAPQTRDQWAKACERKTSLGYDVWRDDIFEEFCVHILDMLDGTEEFTVINLEAPDEAADEVMTMYPILWRHGATCIFGEGGSGKSTVAGLVVMALATGEQTIPGWEPLRVGNVGLLDWEDNKGEWIRQFRAIARGSKLKNKPKLHYKHMVGCLADQIDEIAAWADENKLVAVIVDSVESASLSDGDDYNQRVERMYGSLSYLDCPALCIDHPAGEFVGDDKKPAYKPIGGIRKRDRVRAMYRLDSAPLDGGREREIVLTDTKRNRRIEQKPVTLVLHFEDVDEYGIARSVSCTTRSTPQAQENQSRALTMEDNIAIFLKKQGQPMRVVDIAEGMGRSKQDVSTPLSRGAGRRFIQLEDKRWALLEQRNFEYESTSQQPKTHVDPNVDRHVDLGSTTDPLKGVGSDVDSPVGQHSPAENDPWIAGVDDDGEYIDRRPDLRIHRPEDDPEEAPEDEEDM